MNKSFSFVKESVGNLSSDETLRILTYEVGDMNKLMHYMSRYPKDKIGYHGDLKSKVSCALSMLRMFIEQYQWNFDEIAEMGEQLYLERMQDIRKHGLQERLRKRDVGGE